ncbi:hypothetical protein R1sor_024938 [Riccia sorocarpa]|uniref:Uncharacterized protein n=1 Tax=Riccia sorocarpa TaxID=122646 RepID=A0ABD3GAA0_9MARC
MSTADFEHLRQDQNIGEVHISFAGASNVFKDVNLHAFAANHLEQTKGKTQRTVLRDISNQQKVPPQRDASRSPIAKKGRPSNYAMDVLAQQIAAQVATAKQTQMAAGTSQTTGGNANGVSVGSPGLNVRVTRDGNSRNMLPKVLHRASTSSAPITSTATATTEKGKNPQAATPLVNPPTYATVASAECIRKNRARFDRLEESDHEEPPYPELRKQVELTEERKKEIREMFQFLCLSQSPTQGKVVRAVIDPQQLTNRLQFLKEKTFVLYTVDISPSRDAVMEWAEVVLHQEMGIKITKTAAVPPSHKSALTPNPFAALAESEELEEEQNGGEASTKERQAELGETTSTTIQQTTGDQNQELISSAEEQDNLAMQMEITKEKRKRDQQEAVTGEPQTDAATSVLSSGEGGNTLSPGDVRTASGTPLPNSVHLTR